MMEHMVPPSAPFPHSLYESIYIFPYPSACPLECTLNPESDKDISDLFGQGKHTMSVVQMYPKHALLALQMIVKCVTWKRAGSMHGICASTGMHMHHGMPPRLFVSDFGIFREQHSVYFSLVHLLQLRWTAQCVCVGQT